MKIKGVDEPIPILAFNQNHLGEPVRKYTGTASAPVVPSFQLAYVMDKWTLSASMAVTGGGGKCTFDEGTGSLETLCALELYQKVNALGIGAAYKGYSFDAYMRGRQFYYGFQVGAGYKVNDNLAVFGGLRTMVGSAKYTGYIRDIKIIPETIEKTYELQPRIKELAKFLSKYKNLVITADGSSYALAKEASLKIKETSYINASSAILGEFMHGHVAVFNNKSSLLIYITNTMLSYTAIKNLAKIKESYNPPIFLIGNRSNQVKSTYNINLECDNPIVKTFSIAVIIQLLALETALRLGRNVDKPHGLDKVVK